MDCCQAWSEHHIVDQRTWNLTWGPPSQCVCPHAHLSSSRGAELTSNLCSLSLVPLVAAAIHA